MAANLLADFCERQQREHHPKKSYKKIYSFKEKILNKMLTLLQAKKAKEIPLESSLMPNVKSHDKLGIKENEEKVKWNGLALCGLWRMEKIIVNIFIIWTQLFQLCKKEKAQWP